MLFHPEAYYEVIIIQFVMEVIKVWTKPISDLKVV